ncbi:hypothetical protein ACFYN3_40655 [Streptomyces lavendulae]|uniref:hypothetical protein n=1 Tax=Streptomyces lavendulae TaxID=1914 RepID=UPI00368AB552
MSSRPNDINIDTSGIDALLNGVGARNQQNIAAQRSTDGTTATRQDGKTAQKPSKFTALLSPADALAFDLLAYELRSVTGRRVEKAEILRALIHIAQTDSQTSRALAKALNRRPAPEA